LSAIFSTIFSAIFSTSIVGYSNPHPIEHRQSQENISEEQKLPMRVNKRPNENENANEVRENPSKRLKKTVNKSTDVKGQILLHKIGENDNQSNLKKNQNKQKDEQSFCQNQQLWSSDQQTHANQKNSKCQDQDEQLQDQKPLQKIGENENQSNLKKNQNKRNHKDKQPFCQNQQLWSSDQQSHANQKNLKCHDKDDQLQDQAPLQNSPEHKTTLTTDCIKEKTLPVDDSIQNSPEHKTAPIMDRIKEEPLPEDDSIQTIPEQQRPGDKREETRFTFHIGLHTYTVTPEGVVFLGPPSPEQRLRYQERLQKSLKKGKSNKNKLS
jgi:hypothetical protein